MARRRYRRRRGGPGLPHGFVSKAQMHYFFARPDLRRKFAHKEAHKAGMFSAVYPKTRYHALPKHVKHHVRY
jgi:hypothetical protein